jgi:type IV pilus biogenesis protein CpaD/CtpE
MAMLSPFHFAPLCFGKAAGPLLVLCAGLSLVGCASMDPMKKSSPEVPNTITYMPVEHDHDVRFAANTAAPSAEEAGQVQDFLNRIEVRDGDTITIGVDGGPLGQARRDRVLGLLKHDGLTDVGDAPAPRTPNVVTLVVRQMTAVPPTCGDWPKLGSGDTLNAPSSQLGCATANNLYDMVIDKRDLAVGRKPGIGDAEPGMRAVQTYREGKSPLDANGGGAPAGAPGANPAGDSAVAAATGAASLGSSGSGTPATPGSGNGQ